MSDATLQNLRLIGNGTDDATTFCAVTVVIDSAVRGRVVGRVNSMPLIGKGTFVGVSVIICPTRGQAE